MLHLSILVVLLAVVSTVEGLSSLIRRAPLHLLNKARQSPSGDGCNEHIERKTAGIDGLHTQQLDSQRRNLFLVPAGFVSSAVLLDTNINGGIASAASAPSDTTVELFWDVKTTGGFPIAKSIADGNNISLFNDVPRGTDVRISYHPPAANSDSFKKITVYQKTGTATEERLQAAASGTMGLGRALDIGDRMGLGLKANLKESTLDSSSAVQKNGKTYFEYDMIMLTTGYRYLFSTTIVDERLYVFFLECNDSQWKSGGKELMQSRSSFHVEPMK